MSSFSDRCRTTNNLLGDCYGAAVVEALSKDELAKMDEIKAQEEKDSDIESATGMLDAKWQEANKVKRIKELTSPLQF